METIWKVNETAHYCFHYKAESLAEKELPQICELQESCFKEITDKLKFMPCNKIHYWLCDTRKEVMEVSDIDFETNGITFCNPDNPTIYAVYNEAKKCVGYHEDVHAITCQYAFPNSIAIVEGLAMYFDKVWWKIPNELCTYVYLKDQKYESIQMMILDNERFYQTEDKISYPITGAFTAFLIEKYGIEKYMQLYQSIDEVQQAILSIYHLSFVQLEDIFISDLLTKHFSVEESENARTILYQ